MKMTDRFAAHMEREAAISRRSLSNVPEGRPDWKPHEKSMPLGYLATLVATMPSWVTMAVKRDELDLDPPSGKKFVPPSWKTAQDLLKNLDQAVAESVDALRGTSDDFLKTPWKLLVKGHVVMESPRYQVIEDTFTHMAHHRGQLTVYLRLCGSKVASVYGPSADDRQFG